MLVSIMFAAIVVLLLCGVPIAASFGLGSALYLILAPRLPDLILAKTMVEGIDSFTLLAIPFFILAGNLMNVSGITERIFLFARTAVGHLPGGLGQVNIFSSLIFAGMSGSAVADAGGLGAVQAKEMIRQGYDADFAAGITSTSSTIGPIIPPSIPMLVFAVLSSVSVRDLFLAGILPGVLMAAGLMVMTFFFARRRGYPVTESFSLRAVLREAVPALPAMLTPVLLVGGITLGIVTPTESAVIVIGYALVLAGLVYHGLTFKTLWSVLRDTAETTATVMLILATAATFSWILASEGVPQKAAMLLSGMVDRPLEFGLLIFVALLVVGTFMEAGAAMVILVPVFLPVADAVGMDRTHLGMIVVFTLMLGLITPPVGLVLFVLSRAADIPVGRVIRGTMMFMAPLLIVGLLIATLPAISTGIPDLLR
ncbi:TRAP transporter large permease [Martelella soudanensis]|uniref:TRAP transporter large permease n=1 Tax=unclassified Martelella TaxID=2629616 RepID=UPI0015DE017F|nr:MULTISPECIES: TRAP transporter large permease [unclassified Martelella]